MGTRLVDITGQTFGRWFVIEYSSEKEKWLCRCSCENKTERYVNGKSLKSGNSSSCGCWNLELIKQRNRKYNTYDLSGDFGIGYTEEGKEFYFDLEDYDKLKDNYWNLNERGYVERTKYVSTDDSHRITMHRLVMNILNQNENKKDSIDHINRNKVDNRKENLRITNQQQNISNGSLRRTNKSGVIGIFIAENKRESDTYRAFINYNYKTISLGSYKNFDDAVRARLLAEREYFGIYSPQIHLWEQYGIPPL